MSNDIKNIDKVEKKLEFYATLSMFFPVIIKSFMEFSGSLGNEIIKMDLMSTGLLVFIAIMNFLIFHAFKEKLSNSALNCLNWIYSITIFTIAVIILSFGILANNISEKVTFSLLTVVGTAIPSFVFVLYLRVVSIFCILLHLAWRFIKKYLKNYI